MIAKNDAGKYRDACCGEGVIDWGNLVDALNLQYQTTGKIPDVHPFKFCPWCGTKIEWYDRVTPEMRKEMERQQNP